MITYIAWGPIAVAVLVMVLNLVMKRPWGMREKKNGK